ncbi:hypothetical protein [Fictibacillus terranigra]|uniref:Uncharacterized protein n=1 Tax=Fictibacillus terranigra TaxID=3058424 RepID=A0ABT8E5X7_9BACL|nr:hypothetical protein [Fictibacillus sp. CENA-BCM004]MDN4073312.1 hypothetical protein [Fictibacillus sp. CENA-BCM004]
MGELVGDPVIGASMLIEKKTILIKESRRAVKEGIIIALQASMTETMF